MKIISWNVNGVQGIMKKNIRGEKTTLTELKKNGSTNAFKFLIEEEDPDIICLQEIRCSAEFEKKKEYKFLQTIYPFIYANYSTVRKGYSGTMILSKIEPRSIINDFGDENIASLSDPGLSKEGRCQTLIFDSFVLINIYFPNSGVDELRRLSWRIQVWETTLLKYLDSLKNLYSRTLVLMGDFNVIHHKIKDSHRPLNDKSRFAGGTIEERTSFDNLLIKGEFVDTFRQLRPNRQKFTWHYSFDRSKGYRLDYALVSKSEIGRVKKSIILNKYLGSDHSPISLIFD